MSRENTKAKSGKQGKRRQRGRPAKIAGTVLNQKISVRISQSEHEALQVQADVLDTKVSDMVRLRLADMLVAKGGCALVGGVSK